MQSILFGSAVMALTTLECTVNMPGDPRQSRLIHGQDQWAANGPVSYEYILGFSCGECPPEWTHPLWIRVEGGEVVAVIDLTTGAPSAPSERSLTIADLFEVLQRAVDEEAYRVLVKYHPDLGYPTAITVDYDSWAVDDEIGYTATNLRPLD